MLRAREMKESDFSPEADGHRVLRIAGIGRRNTLFFFDVLDTGRGVLTGIQVHTKKGSAIVQRIDAETAVWDESERRWFLQNGIIREFDDAGAVVSETPFSSMKAPFKEPPSMLELYSSGVTQLNFIDMRQEIKDLRRSGYDARRLSVDYHKKFALPVAHVIMVFLGLPFALECRRAGLMVGFALALGAALLYFGTFQTALTLGRAGLFPAPVSAWLANGLFLGVGTGLMLRAPT
jgi:lipopolysaccharide export LptBFGC system permease protein LptF